MMMKCCSNYIPHECQLNDCIPQVTIVMNNSNKISGEKVKCIFYKLSLDWWIELSKENFGKSFFGFFFLNQIKLQNSDLPECSYY